eukprot:scaffold64816_cov95-Phaeocystis_antarctica.AAC.3
MLRAFDPSWAKSALWRACNNESILPRLHRAQPTATAHAQAFLDRCTLDAAQWTFSDSCGYFAAAWPVNDSACSGEALHVGPRGDGGKEVCRPADLYSSLPCTIVSVGLNGDTRFEQAIMAASSCAIHGYDGTLVGARAKLRAKLPQRIAATNATFTFNAVNFGVETWWQFAGTHVSMLKIDCEGCEWKDLPPWLENVCTDQILIEIHTGTGAFPCDPDRAGTELSRVLRFHHLRTFARRATAVSTPLYDGCRAVTKRAVGDSRWRVRAAPRSQGYRTTSRCKGQFGGGEGLRPLASTGGGATLTTLAHLGAVRGGGTRFTLDGLIRRTGAAPDGASYVGYGPTSEKAPSFEGKALVATQRDDHLVPYNSL